MPDSSSSPYIDEAGHAYHYKKRAIPEVAIPWIAKVRAEKLSPYLEDVESIYEFGVGQGWNLRAIRCPRRIGSDVSSFLGPQVEAAGIQFVASPGEIPDQSVNAVLAHHSLEHVIDPAVTLTEFKRILAPEGRVLVFVPFEKEARYRNWNPREPNHHLFSWNAQTLGNLLRVCGFNIIEIGVRRFGYERFAAKKVCGLGLGESPFRLLHRLMLTVKPAYEVFAIAEISAPV